MSYEKDLDTILQEIIADYNNLDDAPDTTQGTLTWIKSACLASALWGIYKFIEYIKNQIFPDTCDSDILDRHAAKYGITRISGEADAALLARVLYRLKHAPAGGNQYDYVAWAMAVSVSFTNEWEDGAAYALGDIIKPTTANGRLYICTTAGTSDSSEPTWPVTDEVDDTVNDNSVIWKEWAADTYVERAKTCLPYPNGRGNGSIDVVIVSDTPAASLITWRKEEPTPALIAAVAAAIESERPVGAWDYTVQAASKLETAVTYRVPVGTSQTVKDKIESDTIAFMEALAVGTTLYVAQLTAIAVNNGIVLSPSVSLPAGDVPCYPTGNPGHYQRIWDGTISFTEV